MKRVKLLKIYGKYLVVNSISNKNKYSCKKSMITCKNKNKKTITNYDKLGKPIKYEKQNPICNYFHIS